MEITLGMNKKLILYRLEMLVKLCDETEPKRWTPGDGSLFSTQFITASEMVKKVRNLHLGKKILDPDTEREELISIMKCANRIWKIRNKIKNGEFDDLSYLEMNDMIEDYIARGEKINAIKYYRQEMDENYDIRVSLRDAKEYIDNTAEDMRRRGIIK
jgi:hypothetical protein